MILKEFTIYKGVPFNSSYSDVLDFGEYTPESESAGKDYIKNFLDNNYEKKVYSNINKGVNIYGLNCKININMQVDDYYQYNYICAKFVNQTVSTTKTVLYFYFIDKIDVINSINGSFTCSLSLVKDCWTNNLYNIYFGDYDKHMVINRRHKDVFEPYDDTHATFKNDYKNSFPAISNNYVETIANPVEKSIVKNNDYELVCLLVTLDPTKYYIINPNLGTMKNIQIRSGNAINSSKSYVYVPYGIRLKGSTEFINFGEGKKAVLNYVKNYDEENILQWLSNDMVNSDKYFTKIMNNYFSDSQYFISVNKTVSFPIKVNSITVDSEDNTRLIYNIDTEIYNKSVVGGELSIIIINSGGEQTVKRLLPFCISVDCHIGIEGYEISTERKDIYTTIDDDYIFNNLFVKGKTLNEIFFPKISYIKEKVLFEERLFRYIPDTYMYPFKYIKIKTPLEDIEIKNNLLKFSLNIRKFFVRDGFSYSYNYLENDKVISDFISNVKSSYHLSSYPITTDQYQKFMESSFNSLNAKYSSQIMQNYMQMAMIGIGSIALALLDPTKLTATAMLASVSGLSIKGMQNVNTEEMFNSIINDVKNKKGEVYGSPISCTNDLFFYDGIYFFLEEANTELLSIKKSIYDIYYYGTSITENADITETFQNNFDFISVEKCDIPAISNFEERKICENIFNNGVTRWHTDGYLQAIKNCNKEYVNFNRIIIIKGE